MSNSRAKGLKGYHTPVLLSLISAASLPLFSISVSVTFIKHNEPQFYSSYGIFTNKELQPLFLLKEYLFPKKLLQNNKVHKVNEYPSLFIHCVILRQVHGHFQSEFST